MNFFKSKDPDIVEVSREKRVKDSIVSELSACLKSIQSTQQARRPGEPIYASDSSNHLCTVLEAVFLHGHKSTRGVRRQQVDMKAFEHCSFWPIALRVTHKETVSQLKSLAYIKTETGICRAWVRLAINHGLIESYVSAILAQPKVLAQYYSKTALLRDIEQPGILLKLIQVLEAANYDFQLVYNSSQLNVWGMKALALAGLIERQFLFDGGNSVLSTAHSNSSSPRRSRSSTLDMDDVPHEFFANHIDIEKRSDVFVDRSGSIGSGSFDQSDNSKNDSLQDIGDSLDQTKKEASSSNQTVHESPQTRPSLKSQESTLQTFEENEREEGETEAVQKSSQSFFSVDNTEVKGPVTTVPVDAERELARLRTASYKIDDVINPGSTPSKDSEPEGFSLLANTSDQHMNEVRLSTNHISGTRLSSNHGSATRLSSNHGSAARLSSNHGSGVRLSTNYNAADVYSDSKDNRADEMYDNSASQVPSADVSGGGEGGEPPAAKFVLGTPQSHSDYISSHQQQHSEEEEDEEDLSDSPYHNAATLSNDTPYSNLPLSAAQAILSRGDHSYPGPLASSIDKSGLSGNSLGSHGNSLASLSGWGTMGSPRESTATVEIEHVQSYADLVSEYKQSEEEVLGSPIREYPAMTDSLPAVHKTVPDTPAEVRTLSQTSTSSSSDDADDFEVVRDTEKEEYEDTLSHYGELCNEEGLVSQNYKCFTCTAPIGIIYGDPRVCSYTKRYYCTQCHVNEESYIPAKVVINWDWNRYKVCKHSKDFLCSAESMPLLNINYLNSRLYEHVPPLEKVKQLRVQLFYLKRYLFACNPVVAEELKQLFYPKEYLYEELHTYSVQDLWTINTSQSLNNQMKRAIKFARKHVQGCDSCEYRGFLCEICGSTQVIFPFDLDTTSRCAKCNSVYHKSCFTKDCPKCERVQQREALLRTSPENQLLPGDFSLPHTD